MSYTGERALYDAGDICAHLTSAEVGSGGGTAGCLEQVDEAVAGGMCGNGAHEPPEACDDGGTTRPLTRLVFHFLTLPLARSLEGNNIGDQGASALAAILKETKITELECAAAPECSLSCQRPLTRLLSHRFPTCPSLTVSEATESELRAPLRSPPSSRRRRSPT